jgi:hypothetical protein
MLTHEFEIYLSTYDHHRKRFKEMQRSGNMSNNKKRRKHSMHSRVYEHKNMACMQCWFDNTWISTFSTFTSFSMQRNRLLPNDCYDLQMLSLLNRIDPSDVLRPPVRSLHVEEVLVKG